MAANKEVIKVEVQSQDMGAMVELDPTTLDPGYDYRWVMKAPLKVARAKAKGYKVVNPAEEGILNAVGDSPEAEDMTFTVGDVILMRVKKQVRKARRHEVKRKTDLRLKGPEKKFRRDTKAVAEERGLDIEIITDKE